MNDLLLEIGSEEIPAGYIEPALLALASDVTQRLKDARITHGAVNTYGTPRRLSILIENLADRQAALTTEMMGPPEKVGVDGEGQFTVPAKKFAEKLGIGIDEIQVKETEKGRYLFGLKTEETHDTRDVLARILPEAVLKLPFPKTMRWADLDIHFARPIQSVLALLGNAVVPFTVGDIKSCTTSRGHRFMSPALIDMKQPSDYISCLEKAHVIVDISARKRLVREEIAKAATQVRGKILDDEDLVNIVANLIEYPVVVVGSFDEALLELPDEVLITAMREHQKYFAVIEESGGLMPHFVVVNNTRTKDMAVVTRGHEKVLRARLADARFFYQGDLKERGEDRLLRLKGVLFQAKLGSMYDKTLRIEALTAYLADMAGATDIEDQAIKAARYCKSDLVSQVVVEFPKLQGLMGRIYATKEGEHDLTARAIEEHYRPVASGARLPESVTGALVALADKIDTICGCFSAGLIPTGASDPYALRRQTIGLIQIMVEKDFCFSLTALIEKSLSFYGERPTSETEKIVSDVYEFIKNRMEYLLVEEGYSRDVTVAVTSVSIDAIPNVKRRVKALESLKNKDGFEPLAVAFKRVVNIIRKTERTQAQTVSEDRFESPSESALYESLNAVTGRVGQYLETGDFDCALTEIATLRAPVDTFFDDVMVMAEDEALRNNRLALLSGIADLFANIADFSKIST
ncbi:MAG: glycine--tRNA ligase subunit beta [Proteobacteria bacterium]|nr:glycine--tRNA ligase subunit beta [Pseudomonadota bacterium]